MAASGVRQTHHHLPKVWEPTSSDRPSHTVSRHRPHPRTPQPAQAPGAQLPRATCAAQLITFRLILHPASETSDLRLISSVQKSPQISAPPLSTNDPAHRRIASILDKTCWHHSPLADPITLRQYLGSTAIAAFVSPISFEDGSRRAHRATITSLFPRIDT